MRRLGRAAPVEGFADYAPSISTPARYVLLAIALLTVGLEAAAYLAYRDSVDGQAVVANAAIFGYALVAVALVFAIDFAVRRRRRRSQ